MGVRLSVDSLSSQSSAYFEFFVQELMLSLLFLLLFFRLLPTWYKAFFIGIFYVTLLV